MKDRKYYEEKFKPVREPLEPLHGVLFHYKDFPNKDASIMFSGNFADEDGVLLGIQIDHDGDTKVWLKEKQPDDIDLNKTKTYAKNKLYGEFSKATGEGYFENDFKKYEYQLTKDKTPQGKYIYKLEATNA